MWKLHGSLLLIFIAVSSLAQDTTQTKLSTPSYIIGIQTNPFHLYESYSASTTYFIQKRIKSTASTFFKLGLGLPNYTPSFSSPHLAAYHVKGLLIEPGVVYYWGDFINDKTIFWASATVYSAFFKHDLKLTVNDPNWGTEVTYHQKETESLFGFKPSFGLLLALSKRVKLTTGMEFSLYKKSNKPFSSIENFEAIANYIPGIGNRNNSPLLIQAGFSFLIH